MNINIFLEKYLTRYINEICSKYPSIDKGEIRRLSMDILGVNVRETRMEFLEREWSPENSYSFCNYTRGSNFKAKWVCSKNNNHRWEAMIYSRTGKNPRGCPYCCNRRIYKENSLGYLRPEFINEWDSSNILSVFEVSVNSGKKVKWVCSKGHRWEAMIYHRTGKDSTGCPYCSNRKICKENSLGYLLPKLRDEWDSSNILSVFEVSVGSSKKVKWICTENNNHRWEAVIAHRTGKDSTGCPYCSNQKICKDGSNSLGVLMPNFVNEWDSRNELSIFEVSVGSSKKVKWICNKGHKWDARINHRTGENPRGCPYCCNKKICKNGSNSLGVLMPNFVNEWDDENELSIFEVSISSNKKAKWICSKGHRWRAVINSRTGKIGAGCPMCSESKGEKFINSYLAKNSIEFSTQYKISYKDCPNLRMDFYLPKYSTFIEFDGIQHFRAVEHFGGEERLSMQIRNDIYKNYYSEENLFSLIRIHYLDIDDTEQLEKMISITSMISMDTLENPVILLSDNYPKDWILNIV